MSGYNLDEKVAEEFSFTINGIEYSMRYPNTEEIEAQGKMTDEQAAEFMYGFITPKKEGDPEIKVTLKKANIKKMQNFTKMIETEFMTGE